MGRFLARVPQEITPQCTMGVGENFFSGAAHRRSPGPGLRYARYWEWLGYPAFVAMVAVYWLMVFKPAL